MGLEQTFTLGHADVAVQGGHPSSIMRFGHAAALLSSAAPNNLRADFP